MKGRKSARGYVSAIVPSAGSGCRPNPGRNSVPAARAARGSRESCVSGSPQLHHTTPLVARAGAPRLAAVGHEVRVVLGSHGLEVSSVAPVQSVRCSTESPDFGKSECDIIHRIPADMGRFRPPAPAGSKYITPRGRERLRAELDAAVARGAPAGHPGGGGGRRAGRPLRERRVHLRQAAPARNRPPGALPAQAARGHGGRRPAPERSAPRVLRRLGGAGGRGRRAHAPPHRRAGRVRHAPRATSAWTRRSGGRCCASGSTTKSWSRRRRGRARW